MSRPAERRARKCNIQIPKVSRRKKINQTTKRFPNLCHAITRNEFRELNYKLNSRISYATLHLICAIVWKQLLCGTLFIHMPSGPCPVAEAIEIDFSFWGPSVSRRITLNWPIQFVHAIHLYIYLLSALWRRAAGHLACPHENHSNGRDAWQCQVCSAIAIQIGLFNGASTIIEEFDSPNWIVAFEIGTPEMCASRSVAILRGSNRSAETTGSGTCPWKKQRQTQWSAAVQLWIPTSPDCAAQCHNKNCIYDDCGIRQPPTTSHPCPVHVHSRILFPFSSYSNWLSSVWLHIHSIWFDEMGAGGIFSGFDRTSMKKTK